MALAPRFVYTRIFTSLQIATVLIIVSRRAHLRPTWWWNASHTPNCDSPSLLGVSLPILMRCRSWLRTQAQIKNDEKLEE